MTPPELSCGSSENSSPSAKQFTTENTEVTEKESLRSKDGTTIHVPTATRDVTPNP